MIIPNQQDQTNNPQYRFFVLILLVLIAGFSQGMLLPLLAIMLEHVGVTSSLNGLNAAALYIGILLVSPFIEKPVRKYGYKPVISVGLIIVIISVILLPIWQAFWLWFILRMLVGIGDVTIHFATQVWLTTTSPVEKRGRNISFYGLAFGIGFAFGPTMTRLLSVNEYLPFIICAAMSFLCWIFALQLKNEWPNTEPETTVQTGSWKRYKQVMQLAWFPLLPCFCYGFLEASIHGNFPVYALRSGISIEGVSILLPAFVIGGIITQFPLGILSDKVGRKKLLLIVTFFGSLSFLGMSAFEDNLYLLLTVFIIAGALVGSLYSLGIMYLADLLPKHLLPTGNVLTAVGFSVGSIFGPLIGGISIDVIAKGSIYYSIGTVLMLTFVLGLFFAPKATTEQDTQLTA